MKSGYSRCFSVGHTVFAKNLKQYAKIVRELKMNEKIKDLKNFNWRLWIALCALGLIPAAYQTVKTFLISVNGPAEVFDIIGQIEWFDLINET